MATSSTTGVVGNDGVVPVYNPDGRWQLWSINDIWRGETGPGRNRYVPNLGDYVIDPETSITYIVERIDAVTLEPTLREKRLITEGSSLSESNIMFGVGVGDQSSTYRVYLDTSVTPYVMAVDARLKIPGTASSYMKIFKGTALGNDGEVVSKIYDNSGNFISQNIPLEIVAIDSHTNYSIKAPKVCYCTTAMEDGEIATLIAYSPEGHVTFKKQVMVENTSFIRDVNASTKYITHIGLKSPFLSKMETNTINFPLNIPTNSLNLTGVVYYSDGTALELPVDGTKFRMIGLEQYVSSIVGQEMKLVLSYTLSPGEVAYAGVSVGNQKYINEPYSMITTDQNTSYTVKLYGYPEWVSASTGYRLKWFLFNLDRNVAFDVTDKVRFAESTGTFDSFSDGYSQRRSVYLNLRDVSAVFKPFVHTQLAEVMLRTPPDNLETPWTVQQESATEQLPYGTNTTARIHATLKNVINLNAGATTKAEWLDKVYKKTYPLVDSITRIPAPEPTHFILTYGTHTSEHPISDWNQDITLSKDAAVRGTVFIKFIRRTTITELQLSMAAMMLKR